MRFNWKKEKVGFPQGVCDECRLQWGISRSILLGATKNSRKDPKSLSNLWTFLEPRWFPFQDLQKRIGENPRILLGFFTTVCNQLFAPWDLAQGASRRCSKKRNSNVFVVAMDIEPYKRTWTYRYTQSDMHGGLLAKKECWIVGSQDFFWMKDNTFVVKTNSWLCFKDKLKEYPAKSGLFHVSH